jgi:hypothetical protein
MDRRKFLGIAGGTIALGGLIYYLQSDRSNFIRPNIDLQPQSKIPLQPDEAEILFLASLAPSGHNTQPWLVKYIEPFHWIVCNDQTKWLNAVDPIQRETILSIGAFLQNVEYAANTLGYDCQFSLLAATNQDAHIMDVKLFRANSTVKYDIGKIKQRRTVRSNYLTDSISKEDVYYLLNGELDATVFIVNATKEHQWLSEQTIEANRLQAFRDNAQKELSNWIRFSTKETKVNCDGLTSGSMEIEGLPGWIVRNFYDKESVMKKRFREQSVDKVAQQVAQSGGWLLITSKENDVLSLIETGKKMQRIFLKARDKNVAFHPMTQILEEDSTKKQVNQAIGLNEEIQFIIRVGYLKNYPDPVSLRRPLNRFVTT